MKQKTEIDFELNETIAYVSRQERVEAHCQHCQLLVEMVTPQVAARLTQLTEREIFRLIERKQVHFAETDRVLICMKSLGRGRIQSLGGQLA